MATVYLAHDLKHERDVAIKVLHEDLGATLGPERFLAEIKTTAKLQHPHILPLLDSGDAGGLLFYVMPYVSGETLRERLTRDTQLPIDDAVRIAREVADALAHAHGHGIVHRDIKPENILLQGGHAVVADFGIALAVQQAGGARLTQTGLSLGTPQYMAPEQAMGEKNVGPAADTYALGAVTYEMLTGDPPFTGSTVQAIVAKVLASDPEPVTRVRRTVPVHVEAAVLKALAKLPADRWGSAAQFSEALGGASTLGAVPLMAPAASGPLSRRERAAFVLGALAVAVAVGAAAWALGTRDGGGAVVRHVESFPLFDTYRQERRFALSPDGRQFAYVTEQGGGVSHIVLRNRDELRVAPVSGTEGALSVTYSPDGTQLAFLVDNPLTLKTVRPGGPVAKVGPMRGGISGGTDVAWAADGWIYVSGPGYRNVLRVRPDGSAREDITKVDTLNGEWWQGHPEPLPNGAGVLFTVRMRNFDYQIAVADLHGKVHRRLTPGVRAFLAPNGRLLIVDAQGTLKAAPFDARKLEITGPLVPVESGLRIRGLATVQLSMANDGSLVYERGDTTGLASANELVWTSPAGMPQSFSPPAIGALAEPAISPSGTRLALRDRGDVWVWQLGASGIARTRLTTDGASGPSWTPDGLGVTYVAAADGLSRVLLMRTADGSAPATVVLKDDELILDGRWSPKGDWLVFREFRATLEDIFAIRPGIDTSRAVVANTPFNEMDPRFSPDGQFVAYASDESGQLEVYVRPFPRVGQWRLQVSVQGGQSPVWDRRTGALCYLDHAGVMWSATVRAGPQGTVQARKRLFETASWRGTGPGDYDISPTDGRFLMLRPLSLRRDVDLVFVEQFTRDLERRLGK
jgi:serine/threonine-protein kinase